MLSKVHRMDSCRTGERERPTTMVAFDLSMHWREMGIGLPVRSRRRAIENGADPRLDQVLHARPFAGSHLERQRLG